MKKLSLLIGLIILTICTFGQNKVTSADVYFRSSPEITNNKICKISKGTLVSIVQNTDEVEGWTEISYNGATGYVNNNFLKNISANSTHYHHSNAPDKNVKYYTNTNGEKVQSPTHYESVPPGACALCRDGTYSFSHNRRGTCSHHGGVKKWL